MSASCSRVRAWSSPNRPTLVRRSAVRWPPTPSAAPTSRASARMYVPLEQSTATSTSVTSPSRRTASTSNRSIRTARGCKLDSLPLAHQPVGPLAVDLDRADRRRHLIDVSAQRRDGFLDLRVGHPASPEPVAAVRLPRLRWRWSDPAGWWRCSPCRSPSAGRGSWWRARCRPPALRWPSDPASRHARPCGCRTAAGTGPPRRDWSCRPACRRRRDRLRSQHDRGERDAVAHRPSAAQ